LDAITSTMVPAVNILRTSNMTISYVVGDATQPRGEGLKLIVHVCNAAGGWGRGFVVALSNRWPEPEAAYRKWFAERNKMSKYLSSEIFKQGNIQPVRVTDNIMVVNMIAQTHWRWTNGQPPIRYDSLAECLMKVNLIALKTNASIHMPDMIGCGLAGGNREKVISIIERTITVPVTAYNLNTPA